MHKVFLYKDCFAIRFDYNGDEFEFVVMNNSGVSIEEVWDEHKRAVDMGYRDGEISETGERTDLQA